MTVENDFLVWDAAGVNIETQAAYITETQRLNGVGSGIASSLVENKSKRQASIIAAVIADYIVQQTGQTAIDDGTTATLLANFTTSVNNATNTTVTTGECRLSVTSTTVLTLTPFNGNLLRVNGSNVALPSGGITITNSGLVAATLYYVYCYLSTGTPTLELSATGHATSTTDGTEIKSGDATRALVGMVYTGAGTPGTFVDSATFRGLANWFNRRGHELSGASTASATTSSATPVEINSASRVTSLLWGDEAVELRVLGTASNGTSGDGFAAYVGVDSAVVGYSSSGYSAVGGNSTGTHGIFCGVLSEGAHVISPFGDAQVGGTVTFIIYVYSVVRI